MITYSAHAKINISLDLVGRREDGYHLLRSVMQKLTLCDRLSFEKTEESGIFIKCNKYHIPTDERNIVYKVANAFFNKYGIGPNVSIYIKKHIPSGAGLGGGSSDGAAALNALCKLYEVRMPLYEKIKLTSKIGADIPFFFMKGTALAEGIGEKLTPLGCFPNCTVLISKPPRSISTAAVYSSPLTEKAYGVNSTDKVMRAIKNNDITDVANAASNALEPASISICPEIEKIKTVMNENGAIMSMMCGSGSAVFGIFTDTDAVNSAYKSLIYKYKETFITKPFYG